MAAQKFIDSTGLATLWAKIKALIPTIATSSKAGIVKSGGDITVASDGTVSVNANSHLHFYQKAVYYGDSGKSGYINFCTITVNSQYSNEIFSMNLSSRNRYGTLIICLNLGATTNISSPNLWWLSDVIATVSPVFYKIDGNKLYLYWQKSENYDEMSVTGLNIGMYTCKGVTFSWNNTYVTSNTGLKVVSRFDNYVNSIVLNGSVNTSYTIDSMWVDLQNKVGSTGSVYLNKKVSGVGSNIETGWYNFMYMPHKSGVGSDNNLYGNIILTPMASGDNSTSWVLRVYNSATAVTSVIKLTNYSISDISGLQSALDRKISKTVGWCVTNVTTPYWFLIAGYTCQTEWFDLNTTFIASRNFYSQTAIITAKIRQTTMGVVEICELSCISKESGFPIDCLAIAYKGTTNNKSEFQIWAKCPSQYQSMSIMPLYNGTRSLISNSNEYWNLVQVTNNDTNYRADVRADGLFTHPSGFTVKRCVGPEYRKINDTLEINDSNLSTYYNASTEILSGIPKEVGTIVFKTTNQYKISAIQVTDVFNGKRIALVGNYIPSESYAHTTISGRFSQYLYEHRYGSHGGGDSNAPVEFYEDFIYFNGILFGKGY